MYADELLLARIHLGAILPLLEDVVARDPAAREAVLGWNLALRLQLPGGDPASVLHFSQGRLEVRIGPTRSLLPTLTFRDPRHLNDSFRGYAVARPRPNPLVLRHLRPVLSLDRVLGRLESHLRPPPERLLRPEDLAFCVELALYGLVFGIKQVGEHDPDLAPLSRFLPDGVLGIEVDGGPAAHIAVQRGKFFPGRGKADRPNALMAISDLSTAWDLLQGRLDVFVAVGSGRIRLRGFIPLLEGVNPLMDRLAACLAAPAGGGGRRSGCDERQA